MHDIHDLACSKELPNLLSLRVRSLVMAHRWRYHPSFHPHKAPAFELHETESLASPGSGFFLDYVGAHSVALQFLAAYALASLVGTLALEIGAREVLITKKATKTSPTRALPSSVKGQQS